MSKRKIIDGTEIHEGSRNVFRDLGHPDADEMRVKAQLVAKISEIIRNQELTHVEAPRILGVTQPKLSGLLGGQFRRISKRNLNKCLIDLGRHVRSALTPYQAAMKVGLVGCVAGPRDLAENRRKYLLTAWRPRRPG